MWQLDGQPIIKLYRYAIGQYVDNNGDVIAHLNISSVQIEDGGLYKCIASNSMGSVEYSARLNIYGKLISQYCFKNLSAQKTEIFL